MRNLEVAEGAKGKDSVQEKRAEAEYRMLSDLSFGLHLMNERISQPRRSFYHLALFLSLPNLPIIVLDLDCFHAFRFSNFSS